MTGMPDEHGQRLVTWSAYPPGGEVSGGQPAQSDLQQAAVTFGAQATAFRSIMPVGGPASVDGGNPEFGQALTQVLELIGGLHGQLAATIAHHGRSLQQACEHVQERS
jgi:Family of unknown function (DUF6317)